MAKDFIDNTKKAVRDTVAATGIAVSTLVPSSVESLTTLAPAVTLPTAAALITACERPDMTPPTIDIAKPTLDISGGELIRITGSQLYIGNNLVASWHDDVTSNCSVSITMNGKAISASSSINESGTISIKVTDEAGNTKNASVKVNILNNAPVIDIKQSEVNVYKGKVVSIEGNKLIIGGDTIATWSDDKTQNCKISLTLNAKEVKSGDTLKDAGTLVLTVTDAEGKSSTANIKLNVTDTNNAPEITLKQSEVDVSKPKTISIEGNKLIIGGDTIATWSDDKTQNCKISLTLNAKEIKSGDTLKDAGTLVLTVTDGEGKSSTANIKLNVINNAPEITLIQSQITIFGETKITTSDNKLLIGNDEIASRNDDRTDNCTVSLKFNGKEIKSGDAINETGTLSITVSDTEGKSSTKDINIIKEVIQYQAIPINNIRPVDILPIVGQIEAGDKKAYEHIEHLRVAEATRIRDMMWKYGAGKHSPEQYQTLMMRLNTGMMLEVPKGYNDYEILGGGTFGGQGDNHAHIERSILESLLNHTNMKILFDSSEGGQRQNKLENFIKDNPESIVILGCSAYDETSRKDLYTKWPENKKVKELCKSGKLIIFKSGGNIRTTTDGVLSNKTYQGDIDGDEHGIYSLQSNANGKNDVNADRTILVTVGTNATGDIDQTGEIYASSRFPVGFHNKVLFAGRAFPYHNLNSGRIEAQGAASNNGKYNTSYTNYTNIAIMDLCFQMFAEVKDVNELLEMVRSTCDTDYIRLDGQTQELQLMNPAKFFKKYLMPDNIPSSIQSGEVKALDKGYYKGVIFDIPGAEVKINGQWIAYNKSNESLIKSQNPMTLEWRINTDEAMKYGNSNLKGKVIAVDDQWNGLNMEKEINITINQYGGKMAKANQSSREIDGIDQSNGEIVEIKIFS